MPTIVDHTHQRSIPETEVLTYLNDHGIHYEYWPVNAVPPALKSQSGLTDQEKEEILAAFQPEIERISAQFGYIKHDLIVLNPDSTPNLEELLQNFERRHRHREDEVRFIVDGAGIFTLTRGDETFSVTVEAGDLISVPAGTEHYFTLTPERNVKAIRLFQTVDGWVAIYPEDSLDAR